MEKFVRKLIHFIDIDVATSTPDPARTVVQGGLSSEVQDQDQVQPSPIRENDDIVFRGVEVPEEGVGHENKRDEYSGQRGSNHIHAQRDQGGL